MVRGPPWSRAYSARNATSGSTLVARRAGNQAASRPVIVSTATAPAIVRPSSGANPKSPALPGIGLSLPPSLP